jgi:large subunit ribosomal protein L24
MKTKTKKPSKQRKRLYNAPLHRRSNILSSHLSLELKESHNTRSIPVRTGDTVRVMRGDYGGFEGKVQRVDRQKYKVFIDGINREKADGTSILVPIHPSKVEIVRLNLDDKWRTKILERKKADGELEIPTSESADEPKKVKKTKEISEETSKAVGEE